MSPLTNGEAVYMAASICHLGGPSASVTPGCLTDFPKSGHEQLETRLVSSVARRAVDAQWFAVCEDVDDTEFMQTVDSQSQQGNTSCGLPQADNPFGSSLECHEAGRCRCTSDASVEQPAPSGGSVSSEVPLSSVSTLTSTSTLPPSPVRAPRAISGVSGSCRTDHTEVSMTEASRQRLAACGAPSSGAPEPQETLFFSEPPPSPSSSMCGATHGFRQTSSGARALSESRSLSFDHNEVSPLRAVRPHASGTAWTMGPSPPTLPLFFDVPSTDAATLAQNNSVITTDAASSSDGTIQSPGSNRQASSLTCAGSETTTDSWDRNHGGLDGVPPAYQWHHMLLGGSPELRPYPPSLPVPFQRRGDWGEPACAPHQPTSVYNAMSGSLDGQACDEPGVSWAGTVLLSAPRAPPPPLWPRTTARGDLMPTAAACVSGCLPAIGRSETADGRKLTDCFEVGDMCPGTTRTATADSEACTRECTDKLQACCGYDIAGLEGWSMCTAGASPGRSDSDTGTLPSTTGFADGDDSRYRIDDHERVLTPSLDGLTSSVHRGASAAGTPPTNATAYKTGDSQFMDFRASLSQERSDGKTKWVHRSSVSSSSACVPDGACAFTSTDRSVVESDVVTETGEPAAYEATTRNVSDTCGNSLFADCENVPGRYSESRERFLQRGARGHSLLQCQATVSGSSNVDATGNYISPVLDQAIWTALDERVAGAPAGRPSYHNCAARSVVDTRTQGGKGQGVAAGATMPDGSEGRNSLIPSEGAIRGSGPCIIQRMDGSLLKTKGIAPQDPKKRVLRRVMFSKTKICPWFEQGKCLRGDLCNYAHCRAELRVLPVVKKLCLSYLKVGRCRNPHCSFAHSAEEVEDSKKTKQKVQWQWRHFDVAAGLWDPDSAQTALLLDERSNNRLVTSSLLMTGSPRRAAADCTLLPLGPMIGVSTSARASKFYSASSASQGAAGIALQQEMNARYFDASFGELLCTRTALDYTRSPASCPPLNAGASRGESLARRVSAEASGNLTPSFLTNGSGDDGNGRSSWASGVCRAAAAEVQVPECGTENNDSFMLNEHLLASEFQNLTLTNDQQGNRLTSHTHATDGGTVTWTQDGARGLRLNSQDGRNADDMTDLPDPAPPLSLPLRYESGARGTSRAVQRGSTVGPVTSDAALAQKSDLVLALFRQQLKNMISKFYGGVGGFRPDNAAKHIADAPAEDTEDTPQELPRRH